MILVNKNYLSKWKLGVDSNCEICGVKDNIPHMILNCILATEIWQKTGAFVANLNERDIIFGRPDSAWLNEAISAMI